MGETEAGSQVNRKQQANCTVRKFSAEEQKGNTRENSTTIAGKPERRGSVCAHFVLVIYYNMATFFLKREEKRAV